MQTLRQYQRDDIIKIQAALKSNNRVLYRLPTGGGKTTIFSYITQKFTERNLSVWVLSHRHNLIEQVYDRFMDWGIIAGKVASGEPKRFTLDCQIGTPVSMLNNIDVIRKCAGKSPSLIVVDEAHRTISPTYLKLLDKLPPNTKILGVTATPERLDGKPLKAAYNTLVIGQSESELIEQNYLSDYNLKLPEDCHDILRDRIQRKEFTKEELLEAENNQCRYGDCVTQYKKWLCGKRAIVFCYSIKDAENAAHSLKKAGYLAAVIHGEMQYAEIQKIIAKYRSGEVKVLCSCDLITEGFDVPETNGILMMRATGSKVVFMQQVGRALRPKSDGSRAVLVDMVGNTLRFGLIDTPHHWSLNGRKKKERGVIEETVEKLKRCEHCLTMNRADAEKCKDCGAAFERADKVIEEKTDKNEFVEVDVDALRNQALSTDAGKGLIDKKELARQRREEVAAAKNESELRAIAIKRGYKIGWVKHILQSRDNKKTLDRRRQYASWNTLSSEESDRYYAEEWEKMEKKALGEINR